MTRAAQPAPSARPGGARRRGRLLAATLLLVAAGGALVAGGLHRRAAAFVAALPARLAPLERGKLPLREACAAAGVAYPPPAPRVVVRKAERVLALYGGGTLVKEYRAGLGGDPGPDKEREGDGRTPLGAFYVCTRLRQSRFHRFLGLSYPAPEDSRRGLEERLVSRRQHAAILAAHQERRQPPWGTPLGGAIGIHGGGSTWDWTRGCIAVENAEIEELFTVLPLGSPVTIEE